MIEKSWFLLDGMLKRQWGVFGSQNGFHKKVLVSIGRGGQRQWGVSGFQMFTVEKYWFLLDGEVNDKGGFSVCEC